MDVETLMVSICMDFLQSDSSPVKKTVDFS